MKKTLVNPIEETCASKEDVPDTHLNWRFYFFMSTSTPGFNGTLRRGVVQISGVKSSRAYMKQCVHENTRLTQTHRRKTPPAGLNLDALHS